MTHLNKSYWAVTVDPSASYYFIGTDGNLYENRGQFDIPVTQFPPGKYSIVCLASEATEAETGEIVDEYEYPMTRDIMGYENYLDKGFTLFDTALESLSSLLASKNLEPSTTLIIKKED